MENIKFKAEDLVPQEAKIYIKEVRDILRKYGIRSVLVGSRTKGLNTEKSDFDIFAIREVGEDLDEKELRTIFDEHHRLTNSLISESFDDSYVPEKGRWLVFYRDGFQFSIIPKLQIGANHREPLFFNRKGEKVFNTPTQAIIATKEKERSTNGRFTETVKYAKQILLEKYGLDKGGFIVESLFALIDDSIYIQHDDLKERLSVILEHVINIIASEDTNKKLKVHGNPQEDIFKVSGVKETTLSYLERLKKDTQLLS